MNTGLRRGELLGLRWADVSFRLALLSIHAASAKTGQTRHLPLNPEALAALRRWRDQCGVQPTDTVFPVTTSFKTAWSAVLKSAGISRFRWHDLRHHFASRLVQVGVSLNTVRELLGHSSLATTLRYAHLGPDQKREAVALLTKPDMPGSIAKTEIVIPVPFAYTTLHAPALQSAPKPGSAEFDPCTTTL